MVPNRRHRHPWNMNEVNRLYSEYYNNIPIRIISKLHERSEEAILYKLSYEGLIKTDWSDVKGWSPTYFDAKYPVHKKYEKEDEDEGDEGECEEQDEEEDEGEEGQCEEQDEVEEGEEDEVEEVEEGEDQGDEPFTTTKCETEKEENELFDPYSIPQKISFIEWLLRAFLLYFFGKN